MKTKTLLLILILLSVNSFAQIKENVVKLNTLGFPFGSLSLGYERALSEKNTVNLNIGIPVGSSLGKSLAKDLIGSDYTVSEATLNNFHIRAAYRHYTGKSSAPKGFYYEPALKYQTLSPSIAGWGTADNTDIVNVEADVKISTFSAGFQLGYQFLIAKRVTIDLAFFGLEAGLANFDLKGKTNKEYRDTYFDDIVTTAKDLPIIGDKVEVTKEGEDMIRAKAKNIFFPMLRANFSIGFAF